MLDLDFFLSNPDIIFFTGVLHFTFPRLLEVLLVFFSVNCSLPVNLLAILSDACKITTKLQLSKIKIRCYVWCPLWQPDACVLLAGFLSFLVFSGDHHGTFCTNLLLIVPGLLWYVFVSSILFCFWKNCK